MSSITAAKTKNTQGITSISNTVVTAVTNIDMTGFLPGTYDNYEVWVSNVRPANDGALLRLETSTDGGTTFDTGVADYTWASAWISESGTVTGVGDPDDAFIQIGANVGVGNLANEGLSTKISVLDPEVTKFTTFMFETATRVIDASLRHIIGCGERQSAADVDGLRLHWSAGLWAAQGDIQFLGIAQ